MAKTVEIKVPDIGNFKDVDVIEVMVKPGDTVEKEQGLITLETDKAAMDVPSPYAGTVKAMKVKQGDKVSEGSVILSLEVSESAATSQPAAVAQKPATPTTAPAPSAPPRIAPQSPPNVIPVISSVSTIPASAKRMPVPRCASWHASWAWISHV